MKSSRKQKTLLLLLTISVSFVSLPSKADGATATSKETIFAAIWISYHPAYEPHVTKMVLLDFENVQGLPIPINTPPFDEYFLGAEIKLMPWGAEGYRIRVLTKFDPSIDNETAMEYGRRICDLVMESINKTKLKTTFERLYPPYKLTKENAKILLIDKGYLSDNFESIKNLLKFRPTDGFAELLTDDLLRKAIPMQGGVFIDNKLSRLDYILKKSGNSFSWQFIISFNTQTPLPDKDKHWIEELDIGEVLLKGSKTIRPAKGRVSRIIIEIPKKWRTPVGTYSMSLSAVAPLGQIEDGNYTHVFYNVTQPIDNVVAEIEIKLEEAFDRKIILTIALVICLGIGVLLLAKKIRRR